MDRRKFMGIAAAAAAGSVALERGAKASEASTDAMAASAAMGAGGDATPFPVSVMLWTVFRDLPFEERLAKVAEAGYTNVELVGEYAKWTEEDYEKAIAAKKKYGIKFDATAGIHHGLADATVREAFLADLKAALVPMERLEIPAIIVLGGNIVPGQTPAEQHEAAIETLKQAAKVVEGKTIAGEPVRLLLETIDPEENPKFYMKTITEAIEVVRAVNHPQVQLLYDFFHEQIAEGNLIEKIEKHSDVIGLVHVADVPGRHQPGTGEINYMNIYRALAKHNYKYKAAMEFIPNGDQVEALRKAKAEVASIA
ncbi:MAG: TIM barrel protein [Acidobacteriota bacterium]|nr:TIM barrel protein [Acidobacteriota bacterium]